MRVKKNAPEIMWLIACLAFDAWWLFGGLHSAPGGVGEFSGVLALVALVTAISLAWAMSTPWPLPFRPEWLQFQNGRMVRVMVAGGHLIAEGYGMRTRMLVRVGSRERAIPIRLVRRDHILHVGNMVAPPTGAVGHLMRTDILTKSGNYFDFLDPESSEFDIGDIAHGLSQVCRFAGQCSAFYSVAQHSVLVSYLVPEADRYDALMHDSAEAFIGDVPKPLKELLPDYKGIEMRVETALFKRFGVSYPLPASVKSADRIMLATEQRDLMPPHDDHAAYGVAPLSGKVRPVGPEEARAMFLERFAELVGERTIEPKYLRCG